MDGMLGLWGRRGGGARGVRQKLTQQQRADPGAGADARLNAHSMCCAGVRSGSAERELKNECPPRMSLLAAMALLPLLLLLLSPQKP